MHYALPDVIRAIAVDWSGAKARDGADGIRLAEAVDGRLLRVEGSRGRAAVAACLIGEAERDPDVVVGLDFAFSLPGWFLEERGLSSGPLLWELVEQEGERWLAGCEAPFWGRPGRCRSAEPGFRRTDREFEAVAGIRPKSVFQIGGAGAVGTGSLRGMPLLRRLRDAGFRVWPFDAAGAPLVVEIWPRLLTGPVVKSRQEARRAHLRARYADQAPLLLTAAEESEDAFDAAVSAIEMSRRAKELLTLPAVEDPVLRLEGRIWQP